MDDDCYQALRDSIDDVGILNPVVLFEGRVVDGWHRYRAATEMGVSCPSVELQEDADPRAFVLAQNRARRHLNASQMALVVTAVYEWAPAHRPAASKVVQTKTDSTPLALEDKWSPGNHFSASADSEAGGAIVATHSPKSAAELAEIAGVGISTVKRAKAVIRDGIPEVQAAVRSGEVSVKRAAEIAKRPKPEQAPALKAARAPKEASAAHGDEPQQAKSIESTEALHIADLARELAEAVADNQHMARVFEANDQVAAALAEAKRFREENRVLNERIHGLQNELNAAKRQAKYWQRRAEGAAE
ncbi:MAG: hypothetical protein ABIF28_09290 [Pseudomonadota bacterium]